MSREIKFRAWDRMTFRIVDTTEVEDFKIIELRKSVDRYVFMQYTGLTDRNGVEIYEGDVVRFTVENQDMWSGGTRGKVYYEETEACFAIMHKGHSYVTIGHGYDAYPGSLEVIGNIHSNPELLSKEESK